MESFFQLGGRQRRILELVWELGDADVCSVRDRLELEGIRLAYTTVLTVMQNLERRGWLVHRRDGRRYRYRAAVSRPEAVRRAAEGFVAGWRSDDAVAFAEQILHAQANRSERPMTMKERLAYRRAS